MCVDVIQERYRQGLLVLYVLIALLKNWSFQLRISLVNVTKSAVSFSIFSLYGGDEDDDDKLFLWYGWPMKRA